MDGRRRLRNLGDTRPPEGGRLHLPHGLALRRPADLDANALGADPVCALPGRGERLPDARAAETQRARILRHCGGPVRRDARAMRETSARVQHLDPPLRVRPAFQVATAAHRAQTLCRAQTAGPGVVDAAGRDRRVLHFNAAGNHPRRLRISLRHRKGAGEAQCDAPAGLLGCGCVLAWGAAAGLLGCGCVPACAVHAGLPGRGCTPAWACAGTAGAAAWLRPAARATPEPWVSASAAMSPEISPPSSIATFP